MPGRDWHAATAAEAAAALVTDLTRGLTTEAAAARLARVGPNEPTRARRERWWAEAFGALTEPLVLLLLATAGLYALLGDLDEALTILGVVLAVAAVETGNEVRARRAVDALRALAAPTAAVVRDGAPCRVPAAAVVPGDLVRLEAGARVPADLRLVEAVALRADESALTGESAPAAKAAGVVLPPDTPLGDRRNLALAGTLVASGKGAGVAVATGRDTEVGRIVDLAAGAREPRTPLEQRLRDLAARLTWVAVGASVLVPGLGVALAGRPLAEMVLAGLALAFATIPEELPILVTLVLAVGAYRLSGRRAIVRRLRAAETLGSVTVVACDKTGTLTANRMRVAESRADGPEALRRLLAAAALANDARGAGAGDPTDVALLEAAAAGGVDPAALRARARVLAERPFEDARRYALVVHEADGRRRVAVKGAPEAVLARSTHVQTSAGAAPLGAARRAALEAAAADMAARGLRVLAVADRDLAPGEAPDSPSVEGDLTLLGLTGLEDPPREEAAAAVAALRGAGVRVVMLTGDHPATARAVARRVGIDPGDVFARITPEEKLRIVEDLAARGEVVAVTGDGVNDAPALRAAAVGIAMGRRGSDAAREAADLVLADDDLSTVVAAVEGGRTLYANLEAAVRYYLTAKAGIVAAALAASLAGWPLPWTPVQIIVLELFLDLGAATAFVAEGPAPGTMGRPPRPPAEGLLDRGALRAIGVGGSSLAAAVLAAYTAGGGASAPDAARTAAFAAFLAGHVALALLARPARATRPPRPWLLWGGAALGLPALGAAWAPLGARLDLAPLPASGWAAALAAGLALPALGGLAGYNARRRRAAP